jgi:hypothetical protein
VKATTERHPCDKRIYAHGYNHQCRASGKYEEDGRWWCGTHRPSAVAARRAKSMADHQAESDRTHTARAAAQAVCDRLGAGHVSWSDPPTIVLSIAEVEALLHAADDLAELVAFLQDG